MFSLLVSGNPTEWETDQLMRMERTRFREYSDAPEVEAMSLARPETLHPLGYCPACGKSTMHKIRRKTEAEKKEIP